MKYSIIEIFNSIEGEGKRAGVPASFVRLKGCNLSCPYCDTLYAMQDEPVLMNINEIIACLKYKRVTLTGGEPLITEGIEILIYWLIRKGFEVNIETNGSVDISHIRLHKRLFFTMDYKLPSSLAINEMVLENYKILRKTDVIKFVVGDEYDFKAMCEFLLEYKPIAQIFVGAVYKQFELQRLATLILNTPCLENARLQLQYHKIIWNPDMRGV